jgi:hypothetical protein
MHINHSRIESSRTVKQLLAVGYLLFGLWVEQTHICQKQANMGHPHTMKTPGAQAGR